MNDIIPRQLAARLPYLCHSGLEPESRFERQTWIPASAGMTDMGRERQKPTMVKDKQKTLVLIDGHALVHRAFHALPPLNTPKGELVNAVYGFTSILLKVLRELNPDYIAATFDLPGPTFRHQEFEAYKAQRVKAPDELYAQITRVKNVLEAFNIPYFEKAGFEADDIIGTIVKMAGKLSTKNYQLKTIIVTGDLDTLQLVDGNTSVYTLKKGVKDTIIYDAKAVVERYGLKPDQMVDFKGLKGDPSDNIPGVPGIGEKTAINLLKQFGTLEKLYEELESGIAEIKSKKLREKLLESKEQAFFSKYLSLIKTDMPIDFDLKAAQAHDYDQQKVIDLFKNLGFYSLVNRLLNEKEASEPARAEARAGAAEIDERIKQAYRENLISKEIYEVEKNLAPILRQMEKDGIKIDVGYLKKSAKITDAKLARLEEKIHRLAGVKFNINSPQQLSEVLFEKLSLQTKGLKKTPGKVISTAAAELEKLKGAHPIIDLLIDYRELMKLKTTYIDALPKLVDENDRLHTSFDQLGTTTGRLSSKNPNLQNIPNKTELGREIRKAFVAKKGCQLLSADYSQIELRVVACLARDKNLIKAFQEQKDIHTLTAAKVFSVEPSAVTKQMRRAAKVLNFGVIYGMSIHGFSEASGLPFEKAKDFIKKYFEEFFGIARYVEKTKKEAAQKGYVQTLFGRKRFIPEINSSAWNLRAAAERMAINMPIQGTAADLIKMAMVAVNLKLKIYNLKLLLQVHDELVFEVPQDEIDASAKIIKETMENVYSPGVKLCVEIEVGDNWGEMELWKG